MRRAPSDEPVGVLAVWTLLAAAGTLDPATLDAALAASSLEARDRPAMQAMLRELSEGGDAGEPPGRGLLRRLHAERGPLRAYVAGATTLGEILEGGRFNCVSASVLYLLAAEARGLEAEAELLPTHARVRLKHPEAQGGIVVETTSPNGYAPDAATLAQIEAQVGAEAEEGAALADRRGVRVGLRGLLGAMYANRASLAQAAGDLERAEALFAEAETRLPAPRARRVLRAQRATLLSQIAERRLGAGDERGARELLRVALRLAPEPGLRAQLAHNLEAVTEGLVIGHLKAGSPERAEAELRIARAALDGSAGRRLDALYRLRRAESALAAGDFAAGAAQLERGLALELGEADAELRRVMQQNLRAALGRAMEASARRGALVEALRWLDRRVEATGASAAERAAEAERLGRMAGHHFVAAGDLEAAAARFRACGRELPGGCAEDLAAALERIALPLARAGACGRLAPVLDELSGLPGSSGFVEGARAACASRR